MRNGTINWGRVVLGGLVAGLVGNVIEGVVHGVLLYGQWVAPISGLGLPAMSVGSIIGFKLRWVRNDSGGHEHAARSPSQRQRFLAVVRSNQLPSGRKLPRYLGGTNYADMSSDDWRGAPLHRLVESLRAIKRGTRQ